MMFKMKKINVILAAAVAAMAAVSCQVENIDVPSESATVKVGFGAEIVAPQTKVTITPDEAETFFDSKWQNGDQITVDYRVTTTDDFKRGSVVATWDGTQFVAELPDMTGDWRYTATYPVISYEGLEFGPQRAQAGVDYASEYDAMISSTVTASGAPGKADDGSAVVFPMSRKTSLVYFHITSDLKDAVTKATLKAENGVLCGTGAEVTPNGVSVSQSSALVELAVSGQTADDFVLWFNVLPGSYSALTLMLEAGDKTASITKDAQGSFEAGKLYKISKSVSWNGSESGNEVTLVENFNTSVSSVSANYGSGTTLANGKAGFDYTWTGSEAAAEYVFNGGVRLGKSAAAGAITTSDMLAAVPAGAAIAVKVYALAWTSAAGFSLSCGDFHENQVCGVLKNNPNNVAYSAADFTGCNVFEFVKGAADGFTIAVDEGDRMMIDKIEVVYSFDPSKVVAVENVSLDNTTLSIEAGQQATLVATVTPENATNKSVTWTTSDAAVATVSGGVVTAVAEGSAVITATTVDGGKTATCAVTVTAPTVTEIILRDAPSKMGDNKIYRVSGTVIVIDQAEYGNLYLDDGTGVLYVYGVLTPDGAKRQFATLDVEVGDRLTLEGTIIEFSGAPEMKDATFVSVVKAPKIVADDAVSVAWDATSAEIPYSIERPVAGSLMNVLLDAVNWCTVKSFNDGNVVLDLTRNDLATSRSVTLTLRYTGAMSKNIVITQAANPNVAATTVTYSFTISTADFNSTSYAANNKEHTTKAVATNGTGASMDVVWVSNQVMLQSSVMQWQKNAGYILNKTDLGEVVSVDVDSTAGSFTVNKGSSENPTSDGTGGFFKVLVGGATGKTNTVTITFKK